MQSVIKSLCLCKMLLCLSGGVVAATINVPADFSTIQAAISASTSGDTIIVSPGTYYENVIFDPNDSKDIILSSTNPNDPNVVQNTIIDGGGVGSAVTFSGSETPECKLTGFTITNGYVPVSYTYGGGGGIDGNQTAASISHCTITSNSAEFGGGLFECDGAISNCMITSNTAEVAGGGLHACDGTITNCIITHNTAGSGAGVYGCHGMITNCTITGNDSSSSNGGGLSWCNGSITSCTISDNTAAQFGGGMSLCRGSISNCLITGNTANGCGGGLDDCDATIMNCTITANTADDTGGGLYRCNGSSITNCIIWQNSAGRWRDQLDDSSITLTYSCIQDWTGTGTGNIISDPMFTDTSSANPAEWDLHLLPGSPCIDAGTNTPSPGLPATDIEGNPRPFDSNGDGTQVADMGAFELFFNPNTPYIYVSPKFFSFTRYEENINPADQILTVRNGSGGTLNWTTDLTGKPDWLTVTPSAGTLSQGQSTPVTLSVNTTDLPDGSYSYTFKVVDPAAQNSPQQITVYLGIGRTIYVPMDYPTIQAAIDAAADSKNDEIDTIIVLPGTYYENINFNGKDIILTSIAPEDPDVVESTVIDGNAAGRVVTFSGSETSACILQGFTITSGLIYGNSGAGILGNHTHAVINRCTITDNVADSSVHLPGSSGGGLSRCDGLISNCRITYNQAMSGGGLYDCDGLIIDCEISNNLAQGWSDVDDAFKLWEGYGGGFAFCDGTIVNCLINNNRSEPGMMSLYDLSYCLGGGLYQCEGSITNCTITGNSAEENGGGLYGCHGAITNCIIWDNASDFGNQLYYSSTPTYSCIQDWTGVGTGNITNDPLFVKPNSGDYHLKSAYGRWNPNTLQWVFDDITSPCIDTGKPAPNDWSAELWPHGGRMNMGAYGGTPQASMSPNPVGNIADLDHDNAVGVPDLELLSEDWLYNEHLLDTDLNRDGHVDIADFAEFGIHWLWAEQ